MGRTRTRTLLAASEIDLAHADSLEVLPKIGEYPISTVVDGLGIWETDDVRDISRRQIVHDEQLDDQAIVGRQRIESLGDPRGTLCLTEFVCWRQLHVL